MPSLHQSILHSYSLLISHFLWLWLCVFILIVVAVWLWSFSRSLGSRAVVKETVAEQAVQQDFADRVSAFSFAVFVMGYIYLIFYREDFSYYDDDLLIESSLQGKRFLPPIWPAVGRFYPLADQEFNLLRSVTRSPFGYHALVVVQLIVLSALIFLILREFRLRYRCLIAAAAMVAPSFLIPFMGFVYPERNVLFGLAILILCLQRYSQCHSSVYLAGCLLATHFILYYKETVVLFIVVFALSCLFLQLYPSQTAGKQTWRELISQNILPLGLLAVAGIYSVLFLVVMLPYRHFSYVSGLREPIGSIMIAYLHFDWLAFLLLAAVIVRVSRFFLAGVPLDHLWDSLALGAVAYFFGILGLRINSGYYMAPVDFVALLYLAHLARIWLQSPTKARRIVTAAVVISIVLQNVAYSSFRVVERKRIIAAKSQFADFLKKYLESAQGDSLELFFPNSTGYNLMDLASYLTYRGFRLEGQSTPSSGDGPKLIFTGGATFEDNKCVGYREYSCFHAERASPGALVVVLPDDPIPADELRSLGQSSTQLLAVECTMCSARRRWFEALHTISAEYSLTGLPDHWLQLHVFRVAPATIQQRN